MKKILIFLFAAFTTFEGIAQLDRSQKPGPGTSPEIQIGDAEMFTLPNGLKVFVIENNKLPRVNFSLILDRDPLLLEDKAGMLGFVGDMLTAGTTTRDKDQFNEEIDFLGASIFAGSTSVTGSSLSRHAEKVMELMADAILNPVFPEDELEKLRTQSKSGLAASRNDPNSISNRLSTKLVYGESHPYGELETEATLDNVTVEDIKNYHETFFRPNIAYLAIVGNMDVNTAKELVNKYLSTWEKGDVPNFEYPKPMPPSQNMVALVDRAASQQPVLDIAYPVQNFIDQEDYLANQIVSFVLGGGASSRLFTNLREDKGWTYGAYSRIGSNRLVAKFSAGSSVNQAASDSAVYEILKEIRNLRDNGITQEELERAKASLNGSFGRSLESPGTIANFAINIERYNLPKDYYVTYLQRLNALTVDEVNAAARKILKPENAYITVVGNAAEIEKGLMAFGEINRFDNMGNPEKLLAMDENVTAEWVIENYLNALGGREKAEGIKTSKIQTVAEIQGMELQINSTHDEKAMAYSNSVSMMGNVMMNTTIKDGKGQVQQQGQVIEMNDEQFEAAKMSMYIIPELHFEDLGYTVELDGLKDVDGVEAYKIVVSNPTGTKQNHYFSVETGLKIMSESADAGEIFYADYQPVEGVLFPMLTTIKSPMIPMPMEAKVTNIEVNIQLSEADFN